jgi:hypothetical protein
LLLASRLNSPSPVKPAKEGFQQSLKNAIGRKKRIKT